MEIHRKLGYRHTIAAGLIGYFTQAIVNNFVPLLFLLFQQEFSLSLSQISLLVSINFGTQLLVDLIATKAVDKIGYRVGIVGANFFVVLGLIGLGVFPYLGNAFVGLVCAIVLYAIGGGLIEVMVSPMIEACPTKNKTGMMSILHSSYCWGALITILVSTLVFRLIGITHWRYLAWAWAAFPLFNMVYCCFVPIYPIVEEGRGWSFRQLFGKKVFWIILLLMLCAGASELATAQWASAFAEAGLGISKTAGDLLGPCMFAFCMGCARLLYAKFSQRTQLRACLLLSGILCVISYLIMVFAPYAWMALAGCALCGFSVGIMWPGVFSIAARNCKGGGTAMFALMALAGDIGCLGGPALVGTVAEHFSGTLKWGILAAVVFPILLVAGMLLLRSSNRAAPERDDNALQETQKKVADEQSDVNQAAAVAEGDSKSCSGCGADSERSVCAESDNGANERKRE